MAEAPRWKNANCKNKDVNKFFPERGTAQITARDAKTVCNGVAGVHGACPERETCLEYALDRKERFGIWGGMSERERARVAKQRRVNARVRELEIEKRKVIRAEAARKGWENRRMRAVQLQSEHAAKVVAIKSKRTGPQRATPETPHRRYRSA